MSSELSEQSAPRERGPRSYIGWLWTSNPFYIISAGLFLFGLRMSFGARGSEIDTWALMFGLGGYTLLLASAAFVLVRFAGVWNDVRTVLLLVVLMFLATSVTFDEVLVLDPERGAMFNIGGLAFAVLLTEGLLDGIRLRLPMGFRIPYYLTLALFFLYPVALVPYLCDPHGEAMMWGLFGFSPVAGLIFLTLLPAIRSGPAYITENGSPWPWPYYPWSLFVFLAFAVAGRSILLCWSFHLLDAGDMQHLIFGPYFLVPFGLALTVLILELGIVARHRLVQVIAMTMPAGLVVLAGVGHDSTGVYSEFLEMFRLRFGGTPLFMTLLAVGGFYTFAWLRQIPFATAGLTAVMIGLVAIGPDTLTLENFSIRRPMLLVATFGFQFVLGVWRSDAWRMAVAVAPALAWIGVVSWRGYVALRTEVAGLDYLVAGLALVPVAVLVSLGKAGVHSRWIEAWRQEPNSSG